ncbi:MAG: diguanylate cyclase [Rhodoferax sp.]|nr:diguanylate cyclase [Rhodoferax sp.]
MSELLAFNTIGAKLTTIICAIIACGFSVIIYFYASQQEKNHLLQNERAINQVLGSVSEGLQTVMITGSASVAELFAKRLLGVKDVEDFRILRTNGLEAFLDNETIMTVNALRKDTDFTPRETESHNRIFAEEDPNFRQVLLTRQFTYFYGKQMVDGKETEHLTFLLPIKNVKKCYRCHGKQREVLGVLKFTSSLEGVRNSVRETWIRAGVFLLLALIATLVVTALVLKRYIVRPIEAVSNAMGKVSKGDLTQQVPIFGRDELSMMATSFNHMTQELRSIYDGFNSERNKLSTIIMGTDEGIVVTNDQGVIVLLNPSVEKLLSKHAERIISDGFLHLLDAPQRMEKLLESNEASLGGPEIFLYQARFLAVYATTIRRANGQLLGRTAVIRDVTQEKRLEQKLRELSSTDPLTNLANRRALDETLATEVALALEQGRALSVLMFDVDHFKKFNDNYGHDQGDRVLRAFSDVTRECVRDVLDTVCRYGGEEFVVIARETPQEGGLILAERIRAAIEAMEVDGLNVTTSIGVAGIRETGAKTPAEMIEKADAALYKAKNAGRNKVMPAKVVAK